MGKNKLKHFAEMETFTNVFQKATAMKGKWNEAFFQNKNPITLELGCGKGEYSLALARLYPERNFIGIDIKGARIWRGAKTALEEGLKNVCFLRAQIDHLPEYFEPNSVDEIWLTFSDPHPPLHEAKKRLTSQKFISIYSQVLKQDGIIHLKTDSIILYEYTLEIIEELKLKTIYHSADIYSGELYDKILEAKTYYENIHLKLGKTIKYVKFGL